MFGELLQLAISNLGRARARLIMTAGGVVVGTCAVILLIALTFGLQKAAEAGIGNSPTLTQLDVYPMWSETTGNTPQLDDDAVRALWQIEGVKFVMPVVRLQSSELISDDYHGYADFVGIDPRLLPYMQLTAGIGSLSLENGQAIAGYTVGQNFYDPTSEDYEPVVVDIMQNPIELRLYNWNTGTSRDVDLTFSAQLVETGGFSDYTIYMDIETIKTWNEWIMGQEYDLETFVYDGITVFATSRETVNSVSQAVKDLGFGAGGIGDYLNNLNSFFVTMRLMLGAVGGVALLVAAFGVANTMMMAILERTREIGIMKAIGATDETILTLFLLEAGLVGLAGGVTGVALAHGLANLVNTALLNTPQSEGGYYFLPFDPNQIGGQLLVIPSELTGFAIALATGVGIVAGLYPAWRAAQMPPVLALKHD